MKCFRVVITLITKVNLLTGRIIWFMVSDFLFWSNITKLEFLFNQLRLESYYSVEFTDLFNDLLLLIVVLLNFDFGFVCGTYRLFSFSGILSLFW